MEPVGSLPRSKEPATCLSPKPHHSGPRLQIYFFNIHFNNILPRTPMCSKRSLSLRFSDQTHISASIFIIRCRLTSPAGRWY